MKMLQRDLKEVKESQEKLQGDIEKLQENLLKMKNSHEAYARFLGKPHLLDLANEILVLCMGRRKPIPTTNTFSSLEGGRRTNFNNLITVLNQKKARSNAVLSVLSENHPKEWATTFDSINENRNLGIHCDTWREVNQRAAEARKFLKAHPYLTRSCRMETFIISNCSTFMEHSCE
jgi:hypothetical protein